MMSLDLAAVADPVRSADSAASAAAAAAGVTLRELRRHR